MTKIQKASLLVCSLLASFLLGGYLGCSSGKYEIIEEVQYETYTTETTVSSATNPDTVMEIALLRAQEFEGFSDTPYLLFGQWHIGYGHSISDPTMIPYVTQEEAYAILEADVDIVREELYQTLPYYDTLPLEARVVLVDMGLNMGVPRLMEFENMLNHMQRGEWYQSAQELVNSLYYEQVTGRALANASLLVDLESMINGRGNL